MTKKEKYLYCKEHHLCVDCGQPTDGITTRCEACKEFIRKKENVRYHKLSAEEKKKRAQYHREWLEKHPEKVALYKSRIPEYGKRYREKEKTRYEW